MQTEPIISVSLVDVTAKEDSSPTITKNSSFADVSLLKKNNSINQYMTNEWNYSILDGTMNHMPDDISSVNYPIFSSDLSSDSGEYTTAHVFTSTFTDPHSSAGLSFSFSGDFPKSIHVVWYGKTNDILADKIFYPDNTEYSLEYKVEKYYKIVVTMMGSKTPYRFLKVVNVNYGYELIFKSADIAEAKILEEIDPISSEIRINTLDFKVYDENREFNILNQKGKYSLFQSKQEIRVKEIVNGSITEMGTFYLDSKESKSETEISFRAVDAIGIIEKSDFRKGKIYQNEKASTIISSIMQSAGWEKYEIANDLKDIPLSGYIPVCSHREAMQQVAFALRAIVDCSRTDQIRIYRQNTSADTKIKYDRIFIDGEKVTAKEYVSRINLTTHRYELSTEIKEVFNGILNTGLNEILFSNPVENISASKGSIVESGVNYAVIRMSESGECIVTGNEYNDLKSTFIRESETVDRNEVANVISVNDATLVDKSNAYLIAESLFNYYSLRRKLNVRYVLESEHTGRWVSVKSQYGMFINGGIESQEIDLAGGFISSASITGYNTLETDFIYTGREAYTGEKIGVV